MTVTEFLAEKTEEDSKLEAERLALEEFLASHSDEEGQKLGAEMAEQFNYNLTHGVDTDRKIEPEEDTTE